MATRFHDPASPSTFAHWFGGEALSQSVRAITRTMLGVWDELPIGRRMPSHPSIAKLKADLRDTTKLKPVEHLLKISFAAIDAGIPVEKATVFLRDMIAAVEQYAARRQKRETAGLLAFGARYKRLQIVDLREQTEEACAELHMDDSVASLERTRKELEDEIAVDEAKRECLTTEIAYRRSKGEA